MKNFLFVFALLFCFATQAASTSSEGLRMAYSYLHQARTLGELPLYFPDGKTKLELAHFIRVHGAAKIRIPEVILLENSLVFRVHNQPLKLTFLSDHQMSINGQVITLKDVDSIEGLYKKVTSLRGTKYSLFDLVLSQSQAQIGDNSLLSKPENVLLLVLGGYLPIAITNRLTETEIGRNYMASGVNDNLKKKGILLTQYDCTDRNGPNKGKLAGVKYVKDKKFFAMELSYDENSNLTRVNATDISCALENASSIMDYDFSMKPTEEGCDGGVCLLDLAFIGAAESRLAKEKPALPGPKHCSSTKYFVSGDRINSVQEETSISNPTPVLLKEGFSRENLILLDAYCQKPEYEKALLEQVAKNIQAGEGKTPRSTVPANSGRATAP